MYLPRLVFVFILTLCLPTFADNTGAQQKPLNTKHLEQLIGKKTLQESALSAQWQALLYYRKAWLKNQYQSEIEDKKFFISKQGEKSPYAELLTSINAMINLDQNTDSSFSCRFPARAFWIRSTFSGTRIELPLATCPKFEQWRQAVSAKGASVIFPAAYLDSPSSMFGHTLIRLDKESSDGSNNRNALLDYTVSYAAEKKPTDSELAFVYKGLVGGYPGITSVRPYYQKLKEYSDIESRDIWEYTLDISPSETAQLVRHIWEIQNIDIDYYFFTENCSYRVLALLDVIRPETPLIADYPAQVIPVETVRTLLKRHWVKDIHYRPSIMTKFHHQISQLNKAQQRQIKRWVDGDKEVNLAQETKHMDADTRKNMLDVAYSYARLTRKTTSSEGRKKTPKKTAYKILLARQKTPGKNTLTAPKQPEPRDDQGHLSNHIGLSYGKRTWGSNTQHFTELSFKPAYHSLNDPAKGYPQGSELKFLDLKMRYMAEQPEEKRKQLSLEHLTLIGIKSIKTTSAFFQPLSWAVELGAQRVLNNRSDQGDGNTSLAPFASGQFGPAIQIGPWLSYALVGAKGLIAKNITKGHDIRLKTSLGSIAHFGDIQTHISYQFSDSYLSNRLNQSFASQVLALDLSYTLSQNTSLALKAERQKEAGYFSNETSFGFNYFF